MELDAVVVIIDIHCIYHYKLLNEGINLLHTKQVNDLTNFDMQCPQLSEDFSSRKEV